jgi:NitT/TauT family transport system substrate-binding protein
MKIHFRQDLRFAVCRLLLVCAVISAGGGCSRKNDTPDARRGGHVVEKITICQGGALAILPLIAQEKGFFSEQGINAEIIAKGDGKLAMDALLAGDCTFATCGEPPLVANIFTRTDFVVLASLNISNNATKIIARKDLGIRTVLDLKGRLVGVREGTFSHFFLDTLLMKNGIRPQEVKLHFSESGRLPEALAKGEIVAYSGSDESLQKGRTLLGEKGVIISDPGLCLSSVNLVAMKNLVASRPDTVKKLLTALLQAEEYSMKYPDDSRKIVQRVKEIPLVELEEILKEQSHRVTLPQSLLLTLEANARWLIDNKMVKTNIVPNVLNIIDPAPLNGLKPSVVTINR